MGWRVSISCMRNADGQLLETFLNGGGSIHCPKDLVPAPGQYLQAIPDGDFDLQAVSLFSSGAARDGFLAAPPLPVHWMPGTSLRLRGPIGHGFSLPATSRRLALMAYEETPLRLCGLIQPAVQAGTEVVVVTDHPLQELPVSVEIQPISELVNVWTWADAVAVDISRENWPSLKTELNQAVLDGKKGKPGQILLRTDMPCGALAECGVCAITIGKRWKMICKDGPVFDLDDLV